MKGKKKVMSALTLASKITVVMVLTIVLTFGTMIGCAGQQPAAASWESAELQAKMTEQKTVNVLFTSGDASAILSSTGGELESANADIWFNPNEDTAELTVEKKMVPVAIINPESTGPAATMNNTGTTRTAGLFQLPLAYAAGTGAVTDSAWLDNLKAIRAVENGYNNSDNQDTAVWDDNNAAIAARRVNDLADWDYTGNPHEYPAVDSGDDYAAQTTAREQGFVMSRPGECIAYGYYGASASEVVADALCGWYNSDSGPGGGHKGVLIQQGSYNVGISGDPITGIWVLIVTSKPTTGGNSTPEVTPVDDFPEPEPIPVEVDTVVAPPEPSASNDADTTPSEEPALPEVIDNTEAPGIPINVPVPVQSGGITYDYVDEDEDGVPEGYVMGVITDEVKAAIVDSEATELPVIPDGIGDKPITGVSDDVLAVIQKSVQDALDTGDPAAAMKVADRWGAWLDTAPNQDAVSSVRAIVSDARATAEAQVAAAEAEANQGANGSGNTGTTGGGATQPAPTTPTTPTEPEHPEFVTMPYVIGMTEAEARTALTAVGLNVTVRYESSTVVEYGRVGSQSPTANNTLRYGTGVLLWVSTGS